MPADIHAVFLGSGEIGFGLDATGMMGLDMRITRKPETYSLMHSCFSCQNTLAIYRDGVLSTHLHNSPDSFVQMPCGWLSYTLKLDDKVYETEDLAKHAREWKRHFSPLTGEVTTSFVIDRVKLIWRCNVPPDSVAIDFEFEAVAAHPVAVALDVRLHLHLRSGEPLSPQDFEVSEKKEFVFAGWNAATDCGMEKLYAPVRLAWAIACQDHTAEYKYHTHTLHTSWCSSGQKLSTGFRIVSGSDRDGTHTLDHASHQSHLFREKGSAKCLADSRQAWRAYHGQKASIKIGNPEKEFLFKMCQYALKAGGSWHNGYALGTYWNHNFGGMTFWDSFFMCDGMLRAGHVGLVREFCDWLLRTKQPFGRPHYWMFHQDGHAPDKSDNAYQICLAFAGIFIRLAEISDHPEDKFEKALPYLRQTAEYLFDQILEKKDGCWQLRGQIAGDVGVDAENAALEHGMFNWAVTVISKYVEYAPVTEHNSPLWATAKHLVDDLRKKPVPLSRPGMWSVWYPQMTGKNPFADYESFGQFVRKYHGKTIGELSPSEEPKGEWLNFYSRPSRSAYRLQPWDSLTFATSLSMTGFTELALEYQDDGLKFISGPGYLSEAPPELGVGLSLYPTSCGAYLSSISTMFVEADLWSDCVLICTNLPQRWRYLNLEWSDIHSLNGVSSSGHWTPETLRLTLTCHAPRIAHIRIPSRIAGEPLKVLLNSHDTPHSVEKEWIILSLPTGTSTLTIKADRTSVHDILLFEPHNHGRRIKELIEKKGHSCRWLRDPDKISVHTAQSRTLIFHQSYVAFPLENHRTNLKSR
ncbi:hypothetical protein QQ056_08130 [Oscillatoria laete-virens NRMC-F 0139]|nr:hypothetical protein [Oscillatoria laete-virens NRMC-F 0139]